MRQYWKEEVIKVVDLACQIRKEEEVTKRGLENFLLVLIILMSKCSTRNLVASIPNRQDICHFNKA